MQWVHLYGMRPADLASILAALTAEFPHVYAFAHEAQHGDLFLLAMLTPLSDASTRAAR